MRALLDDLALVHNQDAVAGQHSRQPMRDHECGAMAHQFFQRSLHQRLALGIECRGRFIEQQQRRVTQDSARNRDALALAARQRHAALAELGFETAGQAAQKFGGMGQIRCALDLGIRRIGPGRSGCCRARLPRTPPNPAALARYVSAARAGRRFLIGTPSSETVPTAGS